MRKMANIYSFKFIKKKPCVGALGFTHIFTCGWNTIWLTNFRNLVIVTCIHTCPPPSLCGEGVDVFWTLITRIIALLNFFKYDTSISYWKIWLYLEVIVWVTLMYSNQSLQALALGLDAVVAIGVELNSLLFQKVVCLLQFLVCRVCLTFQEHSFTNPFSGLSSQV